MEPWEEEVKRIEAEIRELEMKFDHPHFMNSPENDYDIKSKIIEKQNEIIALYLKASQKLLREISNPKPRK